MSDNKFIYVDKSEPIIYFKNLPDVHFECEDDDDVAIFLLLAALVELTDNTKLYNILVKGDDRNAPGRYKGVEFLMFCFLNKLIEND